MNEIIADFLAQHYLNLPYVTKAAGCVTVLTKTRKDKPAAKLPVALRLFEQQGEEVGLCPTEEDYHLLAPDSSQAGVLYFEDTAGAKVTSSNSRYLTWEGKLKLVLWLNFKLIGTEFTLADIETSILANTPVALAESGAFYGATIKPTRIYPKEPSAFAKYTYEEGQTQFLTAPYGHTAIELTYTARAARGCAANIVLNPVVC